jgi:hypothetical protein
MESKYSFYATLTANVFLDDDDFNFIYKGCEHNYDTTVKLSTKVGGFLYGLSFRRSPIQGMDVSNEDRICDFTARQLGLIMKSFEMQSGEQASRLNLMFHKIASEMAIQQSTINKNITGFSTELKK